jgi:hypothetical protein
LIHPDDDNQWLFGIHHLAHGGLAGLDLLLRFEQKWAQLAA